MGTQYVFNIKMTKFGWLGIILFALVVWGIRIQPTFALLRVVRGD